MNNKQDTTCSFNKRSVFDRFIPTNGHWDLAKLEEELQGMWNAIVSGIMFTSMSST